MTNQFNSDLTPQAFDIVHQPLELSDKELKSVAGGGFFGGLVSSFSQGTTGIPIETAGSALGYYLFAGINAGGTAGRRYYGEKFWN